MNGKDILKSLSDIDPQFIDEAERSAQENSKHKFKLFLTPKKFIVLIAAVLIICFATLPVWAAKSPVLNNVLYSISPETAQFFKPVQKSDEEKGVKMEVISAYIHDDTAEIYISLQDTGSNRIDETTDLFDSYRIRTPFDSSGYCKDVSYDPETKTKTFLVTLKNNSKHKITGWKVTFSLEKILSQKESGTVCLDELNIALAEKNPKTVRKKVLGYSNSIENPNRSLYFQAMESQGIIATPFKGITITALGYIDNKLHIQVHYSNIINTNTWGFVDLKNTVTGETLGYSDSFNFWDEEKTGHYYEYIFDTTSLTEPENWKIEGSFNTSPEALTGNWEVTFPLENQES